MATVIICAIIIVLCFIGVRSTVKRARHGCCGGGSDEVKKIRVEDRDLSHYPYQCTVKVNGMTCSNCKKRIENAFNQSVGFYAVVSLKDSEAVIHMKQKMPDDEILARIWQSGYEPGEYTINYER